MKKYTYDKSFFKSWNDDMSYILGFWFADGYISRNRKLNTSKVVGFVQSTKDKYLLEEIKNKLSFTGNVLEEKKAKWPKSVLKINSAEMYEDLINLGGIERKSSVVDLPCIPEQFFRKFFWGFFDGDGCIMKTKNNNIRVSLVSGMEFLIEIRNKLKQLGVVESDGSLTKLKSKNNKTYRLDFNGLQAYKLLNWMYSDVTNTNLFLKRKYELFSSFSFSEHSKNRPKYKVIDENDNLTIVTNLTEYCKNNNISKSTFMKYMKLCKKYNGYTFLKILG